MGNTRGIHWIVTTHGSWLHGDPRGSWLRGQLIGPDPFLASAVASRLSAGAVVLSVTEQIAVACAFGERVTRRGWRVYAATVQSTHAHVVFAPMREDITDVIAELKSASARDLLAVRRRMGQSCPDGLWTARPFPVFIFTDDHLTNAIEYVRKHNRRIGRPDDPYDWIRPPDS
jgi:hypothetical protein